MNNIKIHITFIIFILLVQITNAEDKSAIITFVNGTTAPIPFVPESNIPIKDVQNDLLGKKVRCIEVEKLGQTIIYPTNLIKYITPQDYEYGQNIAPTVRNAKATYNEEAFVVKLTWEESWNNSNHILVYRKKKGDKKLLFLGATRLKEFFDGNLESNTEYEYYLNTSQAPTSTNRESTFLDPISVKTTTIGVPSTMYYLSVQQNRDRKTTAMLSFQGSEQKASTKAVHLYVDHKGEWEKVYTFARDFNNPAEFNVECDLANQAIDLKWDSTYTFIALQEGAHGMQTFEEGTVQTYTHTKLMEFPKLNIEMNSSLELEVWWDGRGVMEEDDNATQTLYYGTKPSYIHENKVNYINHDKDSNRYHYVIKDYKPNTTYYFYGIYNSGGSYGYYSDTVSYAVGELKAPAQPQNFKATFDADSDKINFTWDAADNVQEYVIYKDLANSSSWTIPGNATSFAVKEYGIAGEQTFELQAKRTNSFKSTKSTPVKINIVHKLHKPVHYQLTTVSPTSSSVLLGTSWDKVKLAEKYIVYQSSQENGEFTEVQNGTYPYYNLRGVKGRDYYLKVKAVDAAGNESEFSDVLHCNYEPQPLLPAPTGLKAVYNSHDKTVNITWDDVDGAMSYALYNRAGSANAYQYKLRYFIRQNSYTISNVEKGQKFWFSISTINASQSEGEKSLDFEFSIPLDPWLANPPALTAKYSNLNYLNSFIFLLNWTPVEGATKYVIYKSYVKGELGRKIKTVNNNNEVIIDVASEATKYIYFTIVAENKQGQKLESNQQGHQVN